jgi:hypothetical protein
MAKIIMKGDGVIASHIRGVKATVKCDFIVVPRGLFHPNEVSKLDLELEFHDVSGS